MQKIDKKKQQHKDERLTTVVNRDVQCSACKRPIIQPATTPTSATVGTSTTISTATSLKITYWKQKQEEMSKCKTYEELDDLVKV